MPRKQRFYIPGVPAHVMQRGHNREPIFFTENDYREYLKFLKRTSERYECQIHSYVLMTNHVHLLLTPSTDKSISLLFQSLGRLYVTYINKTYQRSGTLWEGRHKGHIIETSNYFLTCMQYIELNPVRAGMVSHPADYPWSSYLANGEGLSNIILISHKEYLSLAKDQSERQKIYRSLLESKMNIQLLTDFRESIQSGTALGSNVFIEEIEKTLKRKVGYKRPGRPVNKKTGCVSEQ